MLPLVFLPQQVGTPLASMPQVLSGPANKLTNGFAGAVSRAPLPQHTVEPSVLMPQLWSLLAARVLKVPGGASSCPSALLPQQAIVSLARMPQKWLPPPTMLLNFPVGGTVVPALLPPQQDSSLSLLSAQTVLDPTA